jgi:hypothetical protein
MTPKSVVERGFFCWRHDKSPFGLAVYQNRSRLLDDGLFAFDQYTENDNACSLDVTVMEVTAPYDRDTLS